MLSALGDMGCTSFALADAANVMADGVRLRYYRLWCNERGRANVDVYHDAASQTEKPVRQGKPACGNLQGRARR